LQRKKHRGEDAETQPVNVAAHNSSDYVKTSHETQTQHVKQATGNVSNSVRSDRDLPNLPPFHNHVLPAVPKNNPKRRKNKPGSNAKQLPAKKGQTHAKEKRVNPAVIFRPSHPPSKRNKILVWKSRLHHVPIKDEQAMAKVVYLGKGKEWGMLKDQPQDRIAYIIRQCAVHNMTLFQACSLRRHFILQKNKIPNAHERMGLGSELVIRKAAEIFEDCVAEFLTRMDIPYMTEMDQKRIQPKGMSTPDCLLKETVHLQWKDAKEVAEINWVECKMFYGASTIPTDNKSAVGRILSTANKYVKLFGPGVICFRNGCGDQLAARLRGLGVVAVDADAVDLSTLDAHARDWCAGIDGMLLP
jgi:hypothetical protein